MKKFLISEEEKSRILGLHKEKGYNSLLSEQTPQPTTGGNVVKPSEKIAYIEIAGSASATPIKSSKVLADLGIPGVTEQNFNNTFFYTDRNGLFTATSTKSMKPFSMTTKRTTESPDNVYAKYKDGSEVTLEGNGTQEYPTQGLTYIGGAGNGLLALARALKSGTGKFPTKIKITLAGAMEGSSYRYDSAKVNDTTPEFNLLIAHFIKPYVDPTKVSSTYFYRDVVKGNPGNDTISVGLDRMLASFVPSPFRENKTKYGLDMDAAGFEELINTKVDVSQVDATWNSIQDKIIAKYKENLTKFLTEKFPQQKDNYLSKFNPTRSSYSASQEIKAVSHNFLPGGSSPAPKPEERERKVQFKTGQAK